VPVPVLTKNELGVVPNSKCPEQLEMDIVLRDTQLCARNETSLTCPDDAGGPLQINIYAYFKIVPFVVGVASFRHAECFYGDPNVYTRVSEYIPWIESVVNENFDSHGKHLGRDLQATLIKLKLVFIIQVCSKRNVEYRQFKDASKYEIEDEEYSKWQFSVSELVL